MVKGFRHMLASTAVVLALHAPGILAEEATAGYRFGVLPFLEPQKIEVLYGPLAGLMGEALEKPVHLHTRTSLFGFSMALNAREYDIALVHPFDYIDAAERGEYRPVARLREMLRAILVVQEPGSIKNAQMLRGQVIALPPMGAGIRALVWPMLKSVGLMPGKDVVTIDAPSHEACMLSVSQGRTSACVTSLAPMYAYTASTGTRFRILEQSPEIPQSLFVVRSDFPRSDEEKLKHLLLTADTSEVGKTLLSQLGIRGGLVSAHDSDYDIVRSLRRSADSK